MATAMPDVAKQIDLYRANGPRWFAFHALHRSTAKMSRFFERNVRELELQKGLPGLNTPRHMRQTWSEWDWSQGGEEWNLEGDWRQAVIDDLMLANIGEAGLTVEIGPGGGRWSTTLQEKSEKLVLVDVADKALDLCREKLADCSNVEYRLTDGRGIPGFADASVDFIWSFDVFVHISPEDQRGYMADFARPLKPGARGVIHHAGIGGLNGNIRSSMTKELFAQIVAEHGLKLVDQFETWGPDGQYGLPVAGDVVSVFER